MKLEQVPVTGRENKEHPPAKLNALSEFCEKGGFKAEKCKKIRSKKHIHAKSSLGTGFSVGKISAV